MLDFIKGEIYFEFAYNRWAQNYEDHFVAYRFRTDPVPGVHKNSNGYYFKRPRHANEERQWYAAEGLGRAKRNALHLPDSYDDYPRGKTGKSWKNRKIQHQWMKHHFSGKISTALRDFRPL